jgi:hypothetical protein
VGRYFGLLTSCLGRKIVEVSGMAATDSSGNFMGENDIYLKTKFVLM